MANLMCEQVLKRKIHVVVWVSLFYKSVDEIIIVDNQP
jgi:hypothetical protein